MSALSPNSSAKPSRGSMRRTSAWLALVAIASLLLADIEITNAQPWFELQRMGQGLLNPSVRDWQTLGLSVANTLSFALQGIALASAVGFGLALLYHRWWVRAVCAFVRSIHELFWALLLIQIFGLSPLTGVLALAIPYAGIMAKIYGELFEEVNNLPRSSLLRQQSLSAFFYTTLALSWKPMVAYTAYRFECAVRSSVILGFIGLPTLGFYLETELSEGHYSQAAALLFSLLGLIVTLRLWQRRALLPWLLLASLFWLPPVAEFSWSNAARFLLQDIIPTPLAHSEHIDPLGELGHWLQQLWQEQAWPGLLNTLILGQAALLITALLALAAFPLNSPHFMGRHSRHIGDAFLILCRTLPEYLLAFIGLIFWGPSMLPAIAALALHNGAILAHLIGRFSEPLQLRDDACHGFDRYAFEVLPRLYRHFLALLLYRWEVIMRESAILGILGIATLGYYIDSAFSEFRFDRALLLILISALLNMSVDALARHIRQRLHLKASPEVC